MHRRTNRYFAAATALVALVGLTARNGHAQSAATHVHESLSHVASNGCDWRVELDGTMAGRRSVSTDVRVGSGIHCPNGQSAHTATRRLRLDGATPDQVAQALESASGVTSIDGSDQCRYVPSLRVANQRVESTGVAVACVPSRDDAR